MRKIVLVTGASSGLGKSIAEHLVAHGYVVYGGVREPKKHKSSGDLHYVKLDITSDNDVKNAVRKIITDHKRIDVLVNCAGLTMVGATTDFTTDDYANLLNTNAVGAFRLVKEIVSFMKKQKSGKIINITSMNGLVSFPNFGLYSSSKFALDALSTALHYELKKDGIDVVAIAPGAIYNPDIDTSKMPHRPARDKFLMLKVLLPMVTQDKIVHAIISTIESKNAPSRIVLGRDTKLVHTMNRIMPQNLWNRMMLYIWQK
jgi:short-subunit dehydrogenase